MENNNQVFMEAYYGKLPEFVKIESCFNEIIKKARIEKYKSNPNKYPENKEIQKLFCKIFGFKKMILYWIPSDTLNAFTVTVSSYMLFGESKDFIEKRSDRGFYDTSGKSVLTVYAYTGLLNESTNMDGNEVLAILLHEIGHNFDYSRFHMIEFLTDAILTLGISTVDPMTHKTIGDLNDVKLDYMDEVKKEYDDLYKKPKERKKKAEEYNKALDKYLNKGLFRKSVIYTLTTLLAVPFSIPMQFFDLGYHKGEQFADSFATSYGYGNELISGLGKLRNSPVPLKEGKVINVFRDLYTLSEEIFLGMYECHGTNQERCKETIKKIKADIKSGDYPPELHDDLVAQLEKMEAQYHEMLYATEDEKYKITKFWRKICNVIFGGAPNIAKFFKANRV
jgi:hypothetical protein